jgi:hypothetical protein
MSCLKILKESEVTDITPQALLHGKIKRTVSSTDMSATAAF